MSWKIPIINHKSKNDNQNETGLQHPLKMTIKQPKPTKNSKYWQGFETPRTPHIVRNTRQAYKSSIMANL